MNRLDIVRVIVPPCPAQAFRINVVRHNLAVVHEILVTDGALPVLLSSLAIQQLAHFCWRAEFTISSGVVWIFNALHAATQNPSFAMRLLAAATGARSVDRTVFVPAKFHRQLLQCGFSEDQ